MIDPNKRINWERFHEIAEELLDSILIEELVFRVTQRQVMKEDLEYID